MGERREDKRLGIISVAKMWLTSQIKYCIINSTDNLSVIWRCNNETKKDSQRA